MSNSYVKHILYCGPNFQLGGSHIKSIPRNIAGIQCQEIIVTGSGIQAAIDSAAAGDVITVAAGTYKEKVSIIMKKDITLQAQGVVILDWSNLSIPNGDSQMILIQNSSNITVQGFEICNYKTTSNTSFIKGIMVTGSGSNIKLLNNKIHNIQNTSKSGGAHGIGIYGTNSSIPLNNIVIDGNQVFECKLGPSESIALNGNIESFKVMNNIVHNNNNIGIDFIGYEGTASNSPNDRPHDGECYSNTVYNISTKGNKAYTDGDLSADGIYLDGGTHIKIYNNTVYSSDIGIEIASEHKGKDTSYVSVTGNTVTDNVNGVMLGGYDESRGQTNSCFVQNNIISNNKNAQITLQYYCNNNTITNNTITGDNPIIFINASTCVGNVTTPNNITQK